MIKKEENDLKHLTLIFDLDFKLKNLYITENLALW